jgi:hypothetical protein
VKSLEFEKYQQTFGVCRIDQSSAADVFLIRYFIQVANNTTEMEEDLIKHTSIDLSIKTKTYFLLPRNLHCQAFQLL